MRIRPDGAKAETSVASSNVREYQQRGEAVASLMIADKRSNNPAMTLLEQIRTEAIGNDTDLAVILRKCRVLAQRLQNEEFKQWVVAELDGYQKEQPVPEYRIVTSIHCYGTLFGTFQRQVRNYQIPKHKIPEQYRKALFGVMFTEGVTGLQDLIKRSDGELHFMWPASICSAVGRNIVVDHNLVEAWKAVPVGVVVGILDAIRNRILNFVLEIESENPNAGEGIMTDPPIPPQKVEQIFHTHIAGNVSNMAVGSHSFSQTVIQQNDFEGLAKFIESIGGIKDDCQQLEKAIEADGKPTGKGFGKKVAGWLGDMTKKAAQGMLKVGVDIFGKVISEKLNQYYGI